MKNFELLEAGLKEYFKEGYENIEVVWNDKEKVVIKDNKVNIQIAIPIDQELLNKAINDDNSNDNERFLETLNFESVFNNNSKLKEIPDRGYKFGNRVELIMDYFESDELPSLHEFEIDDIKIRIGFPSDFYRLIFKEFERYDFTDWDSNPTILLEGIDNNNYQHYIQQAFFFINQIDPSVHDENFPNVSKLFLNRWDNSFDNKDLEGKIIFKEEYKAKKFKNSPFSEPIYFFNAANKNNDVDISFIYFYKILEYYFIFSQENIIKERIEQYNSNQDINAFIKFISDNYFGKDELPMLESLIDSIDDEIINRIVESAFESNVIEISNKNEFCKKLYDHRNSIVHSKLDFKNKYSMKMPDELNNEKGEVWTSIIERIAHRLVLKYCFKK